MNWQKCAHLNKTSHRIVHVLCSVISKAYRVEYRKNIKIAYPIVLGHVGHMITQLADTIMIGKLGDFPLASVAFANAVFALGLVFCIGLATAVTTLVGQAHGENNDAKKSEILGNSIFSYLVFSLLLMILGLATRPLLYFLGQDPLVVEGSIPYLTYLIFSIIPLMIFLSLKHFMDGIEWTKPSMYISLIANLINVGLNYLLIYGKFGLPQLGLEGAGMATLFSRILMAVIAIILLFTHVKLAHYTLAFHRFKVSMITLKNIFKLGVPMGLQYLMEAGAFILAAFFIGKLGATSLAAHQIAMSIASFTYMFAMGISSVGTIRVSNLIGAKNLEQIPMVTKSWMVLILAIEVLFAAALLLGNEWIPTLFIDNEEVVYQASKLLVIAAIFQVVDGFQALAMALLRGLSDVKKPTSIALISYWIISIPVGYLLMTWAG